MLALSATACAQLKGLAQHGQLVPGTLVLHGSTTVPFTLSGNHIYIKATIGRTAYAFLFDTGGTAIITPDVQRALRFPVIGKAQAHGVGAAVQDVDLVRVPEARIGRAVYTDGTFVVLAVPVDPDVLPGLRFGGVLGREFFKNLVTTIDYEKSTLTFQEASAFRPDADAIVLPLAMRDDHPNVQASVDGHSGTFDIDSGASGALTITQGFVDSSGIAKDFARTIDVLSGHGTGGIATGKAARGKVFALGSLQMRDPIVVIADPQGVFADNRMGGNIGGEILRRFTVTLDVPDAKLYLRPNSRFNDPANFNRAGLFSERNDGVEKVLLVVPASPAAEAGVLVGDEIVKIDGMPATAHDPITATWTRPSGTKIALGLRRGGKPLSVTFTLRDLL
jgi:hypothetical protein